MTFRVILRKDVIYKNNTSPLCLLFFHDNRKKSVGLGVSVVRSCWDAQAQKVTDDCPDRDDIQFQITAKIKEYEKKIKKLEALEIPVTFEALFETIDKRMDCTVGYYFRQIIDRLEKVEKYGSASKHKVTLALMSQFRSVNMRFDELDLTCLREFEIFLSQKGNVNNSCNYAAFQYWQLYLIEILHQTTTCSAIRLKSSCCILLKFYIKPQQFLNFSCDFVVVSYWNSTSNHNTSVPKIDDALVVSYWNSTSNHNFQPKGRSTIQLYLIEILHQTTTLRPASKRLLKLYLIEILHQTTTNRYAQIQGQTLYLIEILHQTTTIGTLYYICKGCILLKFYIKPQQKVVYLKIYVVVSYWNSTSNHNLRRNCVRLLRVVSYWNSTSNHNGGLAEFTRNVLYLIEILHQTTTLTLTVYRTDPLYLIEILHQTTTPIVIPLLRIGCILLKFYIKPQPVAKKRRSDGSCILLKFYIKPQQLPQQVVTIHSCILLKFYIKPQRYGLQSKPKYSCILLKFYIKPQHSGRCSRFFGVVSYWNSTSNHNNYNYSIPRYYVVSYWNSTSNHNNVNTRTSNLGLYLIEILHQTTTFRPTFWWHERLYLIEILHQTTTLALLVLFLLELYLIEILHQTTTFATPCVTGFGCILLKFYIKPQQRVRHKIGHSCCILLKFYIKPQLFCVEFKYNLVVSYWNSTSNHNFSSAWASRLASCILLKFYIKPQR